MSNLSDKVEPGRYQVRIVLEGVAVIEDGEEATVADLIDQAQPGASLVDWEINGK